MGLAMLKKNSYHDINRRLQKIVRPFLKLMGWIGDAQKGKTVCNS